MNNLKHQYHFEKYLRNEMPDSDKISFEEKLSEDISLRKSFNEYRKNRATYLEKIVMAHEESFLYTKLSSAVYLLVSVTGIAIAANYYIDNEKLREENKHLEVKEKQNDKVLWDKFPLFGSDQPAPKTAVAIISQPEEIERKEVASQTNTNQEETHSTAVSRTIASSDMEPSLVTDVLLHDTFLAPIEKEVYELRFRVVKSRMDSLYNDSITDLNYTRVSKGKIHSETPVLVEFWKSPVNYHGYRFNGKKLVLYGIGKPYSVNLYQENDKVILRFSDKTEYVLHLDNEFHKF